MIRLSLDAVRIKHDTKENCTVLISLDLIVLLGSGEFGGVCFSQICL